MGGGAKVDTTKVDKAICSLGEFNPMHQSKKSDKAPQASSLKKVSGKYSTHPRVTSRSGSVNGRFAAKKKMGRL